MNSTSSDRATSSEQTPATLLDRPVSRVSPLVQRIIIQVGAALVVGALAGLIWHGVVDQPGFTLGENGNATMGERELVGVFTMDYWFAVLGAVFGVLQGIWAWRWFGVRGWIVVPIAVLCSTVAGLVAWATGEALGPQDFDQRLAAARIGDVIPVDFQLQAPSALAMWPLGAVIPIMIASALLPEPDDRVLRRLRRRRPAQDV